MSRQSNWEADELTKIASSVKMGEELTHKLIMIEKKKGNRPRHLQQWHEYCWRLKSRIQRIFGESKQQGSPQNEGSSSNFCSTRRRAMQKGI